MPLTENKPRLAYVDHVFHQKSASTYFFQELLEKNFEVTKFWIDPWGKNRSIDTNKLNEFEYVVFFQRISPITDLRKLNARVFWIQMYDSANFDYFYWKNLSFLSMGVISFSKKVEENSRKYGIPTIGIRYYLDPTKYKQIPATNERHVFFWYRGSLTWDVVRKILDPKQISSVTYLSKPDPGYKREIIDQDDIKKFNMKIIESEFLPTRDNYLDILSKTNIFISPRLKEGIGVSMLEAMACGHCVIAHNDGTMNEYIVDKQNGYLFDAKNPKLIDLSNSRTVTLNSRMDAEVGYKKWLIDSELILKFIATTPQKKAGADAGTEILFKNLYNLKLYIHEKKERAKAFFQKK